MEYFGYIFGSYVAAILVVGGLIAWVLIDQRGRKRELAELEAQGVRRRSQAASSGNGA